MSISKNYVSLIGFVGQQPELRQTKKSGKDVTSFGLAMNESWTDKRGKKVEETTWVKIRAWGRLAEVAAEYLGKGSLIEVEGKIVQPEAWENEDGELDAQTVVQAKTIRFLDRISRQDDEDNERTTSRRRTSSRTATKRSTSTRRSGSSTTVLPSAVLPPSSARTMCWRSSVKRKSLSCVRRCSRAQRLRTMASMRTRTTPMRMTVWTRWRK